MATRVIYQQVSDISGQTIESEEELMTIEVEHPDYPEIIRLDATDADVEGKLPEPQEYVSLTINGQRYLLSLTDFNDLFADRYPEQVDEILAETFQRQQEERKQQERDAETTGRRRGRRAGAAGTAAPRQRIDYSSPEHAGEPHRGTISEAERVYVQEHLDEVNERLRQKGMREIDPSDLTMIERYGLTPPEL